MTTVEFATPVQALIPQVEERMRSKSSGYHAQLSVALDLLLASGGKRVRPTVALLVSAMLGVEESRSITLAASVELLHTATLVHDDLIDGALIRRGNPTLNAQWNSEAAVLAGDFLFSQAAWLAAEVESIDVMRMFAKTLSTIVNGEIGQIFSLNGSTNRQEYYERIYAKTASMFELAARAPAFLTREGKNYAAVLMTYGYEIGMAFQIVDDVLDYSGDSNTVGKPVAHDLRQGLLTLPALFYVEANRRDEDIQQLLGDDPLDNNQMDNLIEAIRNSDALDRALEDALAHQQRALHSLESLPVCSERQALADLADYVIARLY